MARTHRTPSTPRQILVGLIVVSAIFILLPRKLTSGLDHIVTWVLSPLTDLGRGVTLTVTESLRQPRQSAVSEEEARAWRDQLQQQEREIVNLRQELQRVQELNARLTGYRNDLKWARASFIVADVIGAGSSPLRRELFVNQGSLNHVRSGQIVLGVREDSAADPDDLSRRYRMVVVGKINDVQLKTASVQLANDPAFTLPALIEPNWRRGESWRAEGMLAGDGLGRTIMKLVEIKSNNVRVGDPVLACSNPHSLPIETVVGHVASCEIDEDNPVLWHIVVEPALTWEDLRDVVILETPQ